MPGLPGLWALELRSGEGAGRHGPALQAETAAAHAWGAFRRLRRWRQRGTRRSPLRTTLEFGYLDTSATGNGSPVAAGLPAGRGLPLRGSGRPPRLG
eukprot:14462778-Heterocapsa_arctica.AAC.1